MKNYRVIFSSYKSSKTHEWLSTEYVDDFVCANNRIAIMSAFKIGEEIYDLEEISFHNLIIYDTTNPKCYSQICSMDFNAGEIYENN